MKTMQELVLGEIAKVIEKSGLQPVQKGVWANTGTVYAMDGIHSRCKVTYNFQDGYFSMTLSPIRNNLQTSPDLFRIEGDKAVWSAVGYEKGDRIASILHELGHALHN